MVNTGLNPSWGIHAEKIQITGAVQGVGFRPTIYRLAIECNLTGSVANHAEGIVIRVAGQSLQIDSFIQRLQQEKPAAVRIDHVHRQPISLSEIGLETIAVATQTIRKTEIREMADGDDDWGSPVFAGLLDRLPSSGQGSEPADLVDFPLADHPGDRVNVVNMVDLAEPMGTDLAAGPVLPISPSAAIEGDRQHSQGLPVPTDPVMGDPLEDPLEDPLGIVSPDRPSSDYSHSTALRMQSARAQRHEKALANATDQVRQSVQQNGTQPIGTQQNGQGFGLGLGQPAAVLHTEIQASESPLPANLTPESSAMAEAPLINTRLRGQRCPLHLRPEWRSAYRDLMFDGSASETERASSLMNLPSDRWSLPAQGSTLLGWLPDPIELPPVAASPTAPLRDPQNQDQPALSAPSIIPAIPATNSGQQLDLAPPGSILPADQSAQSAPEPDFRGPGSLHEPLEGMSQSANPDVMPPLDCSDLPETSAPPTVMGDPSLLPPTTDQCLADALANELASLLDPLLDPLLDIDDDVAEQTFLQPQEGAALSEGLCLPQLPAPPLSSGPQISPSVRGRRSHPIDLSSGTILRPSFVPMKRDGRRIPRSPADTVAADLATCPACLRDLHDLRSRFYHDPFVSCSQCGPRLSVTRSLPYERARTSLAGFQHCTDCAADYTNPESRRFQSQTASCPTCGPFVWFEWVGQPNPAAKGDRAIEKVAQALLRGAIIAVKGLGGLHLVCDATQESVVQRLRSRKQSPDRPFPILVRHLAMAQRYCHLDDHERALLTGSAAPIVLLSRLPDAAIAPSVAPGLSELGVMLPDSPLHHLLITAINRPLVFTSGNQSGDPPCVDNQEARSRLSTIADGLLLHNQSIVHRVDDSIVRVLPHSIQMIRRSRGYAPAAIRLSSGFERSIPVLAMGSDRSNALCLTQQGEAILSPHLGDLSTPASLQAYRLALSQLRHLFNHRPGAIAVDLHPEGRSGAVGIELAATLEIPLLQIQRHHAQIAACLVDREWDAHQSPVLGIVLDDMGWGGDDSIWGGELLWTTYEQCHRVGSLQPVPLLGGERAHREPWRNLYAQLQTAGLLAAADALVTPDRDWFADRHRPTLDSMLQTGFNSPLSSSCGRLIDAVAALLGLATHHLSYPEQAAVALEALARSAPSEDTVAYPMDLRSDLLLRLDPAPLWQSLLTDLAQGVPPAVMALRFHRGLAHSFARAARSLQQQGLIFSAIALGGTAIQNQLLLQCLETALEPLGYPLLVPQQVSINDGSLALGQAAIAMAWMNLSTDGTHLLHTPT
ncbi:MAG: carbamoyltransferase HypF [Oscillatoriales cyanobacterium]|nr:MAG: carbamoyltransferase HypF [Oscillatoriales cyanobacterium]